MHFTAYNLPVDFSSAKITSEKAPLRKEKQAKRRLAEQIGKDKTADIISEGQAACHSDIERNSHQIKAGDSNESPESLSNEYGRIDKHSILYTHNKILDKEASYLRSQHFMEIIFLCYLLVKFLLSKQRHSIGATKPTTKIHLAVLDNTTLYKNQWNMRLALHKKQTHLEPFYIYQHLSDFADFKLSAYFLTWMCCQAHDVLTRGRAGSYFATTWSRNSRVNHPRKLHVNNKFPIKYRRKLLY